MVRSNNKYQTKAEAKKPVTKIDGNWVAPWEVKHKKEKLEWTLEIRKVFLSHDTMM